MGVEDLQFEANPDWVPGPWMQEKVTATLLDVIAGRGDVKLVTGPKGAVLSIPLGGMNTDTGSEQDLTCDKCDKVRPAGLWTFALGYPHPMVPDLVVMVTGGLCDVCADAEQAKPLHPLED